MAPRTKRSEQSHVDGEGTSITGIRKIRGINRSRRLRMRKTKVFIDVNELSQPIGDDSSLLGRHIGILARTGSIAPISYTDWRHVPVGMKDKMFQLVLERFDIPHDGAREWVLDKYNECWRGWKHMLKQTCYDPEDPLEENLKVPSDEGLIAEQWVKLVTHWENPKTVEMSRTNARNRSKHTMHHTAGSRSFANVAQKDKEETGEYPDSIRMFKITHTDKDNTIDLLADEAVNTMESIALNQPEGTQPAEARKLAFTQVVGEDGHRRRKGVGCGAKPIGKRVANATAAAMQEVEKYKKLHEEEVARREASDLELAAMKARVDDIYKCLNSYNRHVDSIDNGIAGILDADTSSQWRFPVQALDSDETQPPSQTQG